MVTLPFGIGVTLAAVTSVFNLEPQLMVWFLSGMIGFLGPIGGVITKWSTSMGQLSRRALEELHSETYKAQEEELDKLQHKLTGDGDIRTEQMLADLRSIHQSFKNDLANDSTTPSLRGGLMSGELGLDIIYKIDHDDPSRLSQLRNELDANIEFARNVDQNIRNLGREALFEQNEYDEYVNDKENQ